MSSSPQLRIVYETFLAASALDPGARKQFLDQHCPDPAVRQQVELLLASEAPALLEVGSQLGPYHIRNKLGEGGMGCVYEAKDSRLNRTVALKILPPGKLASEYSPNALAREAQAASALNHPNIVTVYEIGQEGATGFIAMERVGGKTLRELITGRGIPLREALRMAVQIADALAVAHEAGIVHRDLKPGNVMVNDRGLVKVLDFGLAKKIATGLGDDRNAPTITVTEQGKVFGTVAYMSPEQAQGQVVDARSDIFSFGCVLYEMITGHRAFHEEGNLMTLAAVVGKDPRPPHELKPGLPKALERIIETCLRKRRTERWQNMTDVKLLLDEVVQDLQTETSDSKTHARRSRWFEIPAALLAGVALTAGVFWMMSRRPSEVGRAPVLRRVTTDPGLSAFPALSRDGNLLAFASDRAGKGNLDIWVQQIGGRDPIQLTNDGADDSDPDISPDGTRVAFRSERAGGGVYVVPALGGQEVLLAPGGRNPKFSPDGRWIAYWEGRQLGGYLPGSARVYVIEASGGQPRQLGTDMAAALYPIWSPEGDSLLVLGRVLSTADIEKTLDWWVLPVDKGPSKRTGVRPQCRAQGLWAPAWQLQILPLAWRHDGNRVLFAAGQGDGETTGDFANLWEVALTSGNEVRGPATRVTQGPGYHLQASVAPGSTRSRMVFGDLDWRLGVWEADLDADRGVVRGELKRLTEQESHAVASSLSQDGHTLAYLSRRLGRWTIEARDLPRGKQLTLVAGLDMSPIKMSGDGRSIVYSFRAGDIFSVPRAGGPVSKLCQECGTPMGVSFDGKKVSYEPLTSEDLTMYDVRLGKSVMLAPRPESDTILSGGRFSPDEKWIAFHEVQSRTGTTQVWIARLNDNAPVKPNEWIAITDGHVEDRDPVWSPDGNLLYFLSDRDGFRCVWAVKLDPQTRRPLGPAFEVQPFHSARRSLQRVTGGAGYIGLSVATGKLVLSFGDLSGNIWLEESSK